MSKKMKKYFVDGFNKCNQNIYKEQTKSCTDKFIISLNKLFSEKYTL